MTDTQNPQSPGTPPTPGQAPTPQIPTPQGSTALKKVIVAVIALILVGAVAAAFYFLPQLFTKRQTTSTPTVQTEQPAEQPPTVIANPESTSTQSEVATTTTSPITTTEPEPEGVTFQTEVSFGQEVQMFTGDIVTLGDSTRSYSVKAAEFTDSRCPEGVQCFWAGERGVRLEVTDLLKDKIEDMRLGMTTAKTLEVMGLRGTLIEIEDGKGGPYATIKFE